MCLQEQEIMLNNIPITISISTPLNIYQPLSCLDRIAKEFERHENHLENIWTVFTIGVEGHLENHNMCEHVMTYKDFVKWLKAMKVKWT